VINLDNNQVGFILSLLAALATMIGWVIVAVRKNLSQYLVAASLLVAAAAMILLSAFELIPTAKVAISTAIVDFQSGLVAALAISLHNIPEGLAIAVTAVAAGMSSKKVFALVAAATVAEISGAAVVLYESAALSEILVAKLLTLVAGIMFTVAITELIPHGLSSLKASRKKSKLD